MKSIDKLRASLQLSWQLDNRELRQIAPTDEALRQLYLIHLTLADLFVDPQDEAQWMRNDLVLEGLSPIACIMAGNIDKLTDMVLRMTNR